LKDFSASHESEINLRLTANQFEESVD